MDLHFVISQKDLEPESNVLTGKDIETIEMFQEGEQIGSYRIKKLAAKFMVDKEGKPIPYQRAIRMFDDMQAEEYADGLKQFMEAMNEAAIPKVKGTPSKSPSEAVSQKPAESLDG